MYAIRSYYAIRARFNEREQRSSLLLDVDSEGRLIARDERHQAILVALPKAEGIPGWLRQRQTEQLDELLQALGQQQQALLNQRRSFAAQCPHLFLEQSWLRQVEESLLALVEQAETLQQQLQQQRQELVITSYSIHYTKLYEGSETVDKAVQSRTIAKRPPLEDETPCSRRSP